MLERHSGFFGAVHAQNGFGVVKADRQFVEYHKFLTLLHLNGQHTGITVEGTDTGSVAFLHAGHIKGRHTAANGAFHALGQAVGGQEEVVHHPAGLEAQVAFAFGQ
ncbi:MAG: hypothetical protein BWY72_02288 [Bacteroidetes bacterium ADurb.Bin416]|nr:MAG: hypothetical protein BWY72_02288 [Bacteroidetes bacterium ADurb.Bin416]